MMPNPPATWLKRMVWLAVAFIVGCTAADWADMLDTSSPGSSDTGSGYDSQGGYGRAPAAAGAPGWDGDSSRYQEENQPRMSAALEHLQDAKSELEQADTNKGGYRRDAIDHVEAAIDAVQNGMAYDDTH